MSWAAGKQCQEVRTPIHKKLIREAKEVSVQARTTMDYAQAPLRSDRRALTPKV